MSSPKSRPESLPPAFKSFSRHKLRFFPSRVTLGERTERAAMDYLHAHGCQLIERNVRFRVGEIDLVVRDGDCLVFVEVRGRATHSLEAAEIALPREKRLKLWKAIELYLLRLDPRNRLEFKSIRIDFLSTNGTQWFWYRNIELR